VLPNQPYLEPRRASPVLEYRTGGPSKLSRRWSGYSECPRAPPIRLSLLHLSLVSIQFSPAASANAGAQSAVTASFHSEDRRSEVVTALQTSLRVL